MYIGIMDWMQREIRALAPNRMEIMTSLTLDTSTWWGGSGLHPNLTVHLPTDVGGPPGPASPQMLLRLNRHIALAV